MRYKMDFTKIAAAVTLAGVLLTGCGKELPEQTNVPEETQIQSQTDIQTLPTEEVSTTASQPVDILEILAYREADARVMVETSWCTVAYPYAFSDLMKVSCSNGEMTGRLEFGAQLEQGVCPLFYLSFGEESGFLLGRLTLPETGEVVEVWAGLYSLDAELTDAERDACLVGQESINDVIASLNENGNFVSED